MHYVYQNKENILLQVELPGVTLEGLEVTVENDVLHVKAIRKKPEAKLLLREITSSDIHKSFQINHKLNLENIQAKLKNGILSLIFEKNSYKKDIDI